MPLHESEAIVLQSYPLGEADRLVSFLSRTIGRVRGVASGARRTKSRFGSTLERLSHVRIWFFEKETRELVRINQCELIESFLNAFRDYASGIALAILSEVTEAVLPDREASDANFRLLLDDCASRETHGQIGSATRVFRVMDGEAWRVAAASGCLRKVRKASRCRGAGIFFAERFGARLRQVPQARPANNFGVSAGRCAADAHGAA